MGVGLFVVVVLSVQWLAEAAPVAAAALAAAAAAVAAAAAAAAAILTRARLHFLFSLYSFPLSGHLQLTHPTFDGQQSFHTKLASAI